MFLGINIFWALLRAHFNPRLTARAKMSLSRAQNTFMPANINSIVLIYRKWPINSLPFYKSRTLSLHYRDRSRPWIFRSRKRTFMFRRTKAFSLLQTTLWKSFPHQASKLLVDAGVYNGTKNCVEIRQPFRQTSTSLVNPRKKRKSDANKNKRCPTAQKCSNHKTDRLGGF